MKSTAITDTKFNDKCDIIYNRFNTLDRYPISQKLRQVASAFILTDSKKLSKDDLNSASFGLFAGAGVDFSILFVEAKYE